jgi:hypothetical protein
LLLYTANKTPSGGGFEDGLRHKQAQARLGWREGNSRPAISSSSSSAALCPKEKKGKKGEIQPPDYLYPQETLRFTRLVVGWIG